MDLSKSSLRSHWTALGSFGTISNGNGGRKQKKPWQTWKKECPVSAEQWSKEGEVTLKKAKSRMYCLFSLNISLWMNINFSLMQFSNKSWKLSVRKFLCDNVRKASSRLAICRNTMLSSHPITITELVLLTVNFSSLYGTLASIMSCSL